MHLAISQEEYIINLCIKWHLPKFQGDTFTSYICLPSFLDLETFSFSFLFCQFWFQKILNFDQTFFVKTPARCELSLFWTLIHSWAHWAWDYPARVSVFFKLFVHLDSRADSAAQLSLCNRNILIFHFLTLILTIFKNLNVGKNRELQVVHRELQGLETYEKIVNCKFVNYETVNYEDPLYPAKSLCDLLKEKVNLL